MLDQKDGTSLKCGSLNVLVATTQDDTRRAASASPSQANLTYTAQ